MCAGEPQKPPKLKIQQPSYFPLCPGPKPIKQSSAEKTTPSGTVKVVI